MSQKKTDVTKEKENVKTSTKTATKKRSNATKSSNVKKEAPKEKMTKEVVIEKKIDSKNYIIALAILLGAILLVLYIFKWYQVKEEEKLMTSYLISSNTVDSSINDLNSLSQIRQEAPSSYFIYLGYTKDEDVYNLEKGLKRLIDKYKLNDIFYYVDLTKLKESDNNYLETIEKSLDIKDLEQIPAIIYVRNGEILDTNILDGVNGTSLKADDLEELLDIYEFEAIK